MKKTFRFSSLFVDTEIFPPSPSSALNLHESLLHLKEVLTNGVNNTYAARVEDVSKRTSARAVAMPSRMLSGEVSPEENDGPLSRGGERGGRTERLMPYRTFILMSTVFVLLSKQYLSPCLAAGFGVRSRFSLSCVTKCQVVSQWFVTKGGACGP